MTLSTIFCIFDGIVALHPEGVDRNPDIIFTQTKDTTSPSTRRAWIEILFLRGDWTSAAVALHPEGVDRNSSARSGQR